MCEDTYTKVKGNKITLYTKGNQWTSEHRKLIRVTDNGNGYTVKDYSWSSTVPHMYYNIPYDVADNLVKVLLEFENYFPNVEEPK